MQLTNHYHKALQEVSDFYAGTLFRKTDAPHLSHLLTISSKCMEISLNDHSPTLALMYDRYKHHRPSESVLTRLYGKVVTEKLLLFGSCSSDCFIERVRFHRNDSVFMPVVITSMLDTLERVALYKLKISPTELRTYEIIINIVGSEFRLNPAKEWVRQISHYINVLKE